MEKEDTFVCKRSGKIEHVDNGFLVPNLGMVSDNHMTKEDWRAWDKHNAQVNPDSYSEEELKDLLLEDARNLGYACMLGEYPHEWEAAHHLMQGGFQCVACGEWRQAIDEEESVN